MSSGRSHILWINHRIFSEDRRGNIAVSANPTRIFQCSRETKTNVMSSSFVPFIFVGMEDHQVLWDGWYAVARSKYGEYVQLLVEIQKGSLTNA